MRKNDGHSKSHDDIAANKTRRKGSDIGAAYETKKINKWNNLYG